MALLTDAEEEGGAAARGETLQMATSHGFRATGVRANEVSGNVESSSVRESEDLKVEMEDVEVESTTPMEDGCDSGVAGVNLCFVAASNADLR